MNKETSFTIFCLESYKAYRNLTGIEVMKLFKQYDVFQYIRDFYDILHTTGHNYINHEIDCYLAARNVVFPKKSL